MSVLPFVVFAAGVLPVVWSWLNEEDRKAIRAMARVRRKRISELREGERARLVGVVESREPPLHAPLSARPCLAWASLIMQAMRRFRHSRSVALTLRDPTGEVQLGNLRFVLRFDKRWDFAAFTDVGDLPAPLQLFVEAQLPDVEARALHFCEGVVRAGDEVAVTGVVRWELDPDGAGGGYRDAARRLVLEDCVLSNDPRARR